MDLYAGNIQNLAESDKLLLVQRIWDDLAASDSIPLPEWLVSEARRRRDEMMENPDLGYSHEEIVNRIRAWRNG
jgi:putative addiction module component (TIGR02574 family)